MVAILEMSILFYVVLFVVGPKNDATIFPFLNNTYLITKITIVICLDAEI